MAEHEARRRRPAARRLRYPAACAVCGRQLEPGTMAVWRPERRTATCMACVEGATVDGADAGVAGASARREGHRRGEAQQATDGAGGMWRRITRTGRGPSDAAGASWLKGAAGEERLGSLLDRLASEGTIEVIHDRALPRSSANLDHLAVTAAAVWVIDAKSYRGRVELVDKGTPARPDPRLIVDGRDRTAQLVQGSRWQAEQVRIALDPTYRDVPVRQAVCFVDAKRRLGSKARTIDGTLVTWEKDLVRRLREPGSIDERFRKAMQHHLATRLRPAAGGGPTGRPT